MNILIFLQIIGEVIIPGIMNNSRIEKKKLINHFCTSKEKLQQ